MAVTGCINQVDESKVVLKVGSKTYSNDDISDRIGIANDPSVKAYFESKENPFFHFSSDGGKYFPISPKESAPNNASIIE